MPLEFRTTININSHFSVFQTSYDLPLFITPNTTSIDVVACYVQTNKKKLVSKLSPLYYLFKQF